MQKIKKVALVVASLVVLVGCAGQDSKETGNDSNSPSGYDIISYEDLKSDSSYEDLVELRNKTLPEAYDDTHVRGDLVNVETPYELDYTHYNKLTPDQAEDFLAKKESGIVYFGWTECVYCYRIRQTVDFVLEDLEQDIYYVEIGDLHKTKGEQSDDILESYNVTSTPTFLVLKDGVEVDRMSAELQGELDYLDVLSWFRDSAKEVFEVE